MKVLIMKKIICILFLLLFCYSCRSQTEPDSIIVQGNKIHVVSRRADSTIIHPILGIRLGIDNSWLGYDMQIGVVDDSTVWSDIFINRKDNRDTIRFMEQTDNLVLNNIYQYRVRAVVDTPRLVLIVDDTARYVYGRSNWKYTPTYLLVDSTYTGPVYVDSLFLAPELIGNIGIIQKEN